MPGINALSISIYFWISTSLIVASIQKEIYTKFASLHKVIKLSEYKIGKCQLLVSMVNELDKIHEANVYSSIQQNILRNSNKVRILRATILNR